VIREPEISGKPISSHLLANLRILVQEMMNLAFEVVFLNAVKSYDMGPTALLPFRRKVCCGFLSLLKICRFGRV
jgi:hypothetical protein